MAGLPHKVKLAINTKTYTDDNGEDFTVSMSVYDKEDFTGLGTFSLTPFVALTVTSSLRNGHFYVIKCKTF